MWFYHYVIWCSQFKNVYKVFVQQTFIDIRLQKFINYNISKIPICQKTIIDASNKYPDAGFIYTDSVELDENNNSMTYGEGFCFGYGKYRKEFLYGKNWDVIDSANINPKTIRHIVGVPNHVRTWRRDVYFSVGGHNRDLAIADDYELIVRTFLKTKFVRVSKLGYLQYIYHNTNGRNTHDLSRADIQRRVRSIS